MDETFEIKTKCMLCVDVNIFIELVYDGDYLRYKLGDTVKKVCQKCKAIDALVCIKTTKIAGAATN